MEAPAKKTKLPESIDVDKIVIGRDYYFSNAYVIDLPLDSVPDHVWQTIFDRNWKSSRQLWDRKLFVIGDRLRMVTTVDDLEDKLDWVKQVIDQTNKNIEDYNRERSAYVARIAEEIRIRESEEKKDVDAIREYLRKRVGTI